MDINAFVSSNRERFESLLREFVEIPSISMDPTKKRDIRRLADRAIRMLREIGFQAKNEFFNWGQAEVGMKVFSNYFRDISKP